MGVALLLALHGALHLVVFAGAGMERVARVAFAADGPVSIGGACWTIARPGWVMTSAGLAAVAAWNALLAAWPSWRCWRSAGRQGLVASCIRRMASAIFCSRVTVAGSDDV